MSPQNAQRCLTMFLLSSLTETLSSSLKILLPKLIINIIIDFHQESIQSAFWNRKILIYPLIYITGIFVTNSLLTGIISLALLEPKL